MFDIKAQLKKLPETPGVYLMKDRDGTIIYVGKAKSLKKRVSSYFMSLSSHAPKTKTMVVNIAEFEYILTKTEMEALILEQTLIKKYKPRFNILLKDDKQYPYIKVTVNDEFPRVFMTRSVSKDKALYFGPYTSTDAVRKTLEIIHSVYPVRTCSKSLKSRNDRPCLNYHIGQCLGPCSGNVTPESYRPLIESIVEILGGKIEKLVDIVRTRMEEESARLNFEKAAVYRDYYRAVMSLTEKQTVVSQGGMDQDVIGIYAGSGKVCFMIFFVRGGKLMGRDQFVMEYEGDDVHGETAYDFITQYYSGSLIFPREIIVSHEFEDHALLEEWLSSKAGRKVSLLFPKRGDRKRLLEMAVDNAVEYMDKFADKINAEIELHNHLNRELKAIMDISSDIYRIEAYDISNLYGVHNVGAMVVFEGWKKKSADYRKFRIKSVVGADDYASMREVIGRRFKRGMDERKGDEAPDLSDRFSVFPDLILIDGGKNHVMACLEVLGDLGISIPVGGIAKDDKHRTDRIYVPNRDAYFDIKKDPDIYRFMSAVGDEVHRFSIDYHRQLRSKSVTQSILDEIPGIGPVRRKSLLLQFGTIEKMKSASLEDLENTPGMNRESARKVYEYFNSEGGKE
jgi:excinuclease ABC subunit C